MLKRTITVFLLLALFAILLSGFAHPVEAAKINTDLSTCPYAGPCGPWPDPWPVPWPWPDPDPWPDPWDPEPIWFMGY